MAGGNSGSSGGSQTQGGTDLDAMNVDKQNKHIPGARGFDPSKSYFDISAEELDALIRANIDNAEPLSSGKMELELPKEVGYWKSIDGTKIEKTNRVTIHRSKTGYHAVPARKKKGKK